MFIYALIRYIAQNEDSLSKLEAGHTLDYK